MIFLIKIYQSLPLSSHSNCKYIPTCSNYAITVLDDFGSIKGSYLTLKRLIKCNPFSAGGIDNLTLPLGVAGVTYLLIREPLFTKFSIAFAVTGLIVWVALLNRMLSYAGGLAAMVLGVIIFYYDGPIAALAVIFFFVTSAILEHYHYCV